MMIMYTSGTTGRPKGAVHVHGGFLVKIAQEVAHQADMHADDVLHWVTDLGWIMGPWELVGGLAAGGTVVLAEGVPDYPAPDRLWSMVERHGITILGVSPTLVRALIKHGDEPFDRMTSPGCGSWPRPASRGTPSPGDGCSSTRAGAACRSSTSPAGRRSAPACSPPSRPRR